ncbi:MAG: CapA family protein [Coriobacteriales bacterium]|jgi:poly-gamma-glutamate synthesis protein (capsule biosynthesis protein)|nr:CapA family protein [Coriobacteriales bacterium]
MILDETIKRGFRLAYPFVRRRYERSWPIEGTMEHLGKGETLYWCFKCFCHPITQAEPGWGIEERFAPLAATSDDAGEGYPRFEPPSVPDGFTVQSRARIACAGDLLATRAVAEADTTHLLDDVADFFADTDLRYANLECPVVPSRPAVGTPPETWLKPLYLNHSADLIRRLLPDPFGFVSIANNHSLDQGPDGLIETMDFLDDLGCAYVGGARSVAERDQPHITELNGIRVAHISWTFSLSNKPLPPERDYLVNYLRLNLADVDLEPLEAQVRAARAAGADLIVAYLHWGLEFEAYPNHTLIANAHRIVELGVDVIVGNHPHNVQPWEWHSYTAQDDEGRATERTGLIIYAQGDFASFQSRDMCTATYLGALVRIDFAKGRDRAGRECAWVSALQVMPVFPFAVFDGSRCVEFRMLDLSRLARNGFDCDLAGYGAHHRRRTRKLWDNALIARLRGV